MSPTAQSLDDLRYMADHAVSADNRVRFEKSALQVAAVIIASSCLPGGLNEVPSGLTTPGSSGHRAGIRLSNLDVNQRLVKRGLKVSYQGRHALVVRVNRGACYVGYLDAFQRFTGERVTLVCERVQVVA